jgi:hypothetical protein
MTSVLAHAPEVAVVQLGQRVWDLLLPQ